ncbi:alpha/beta hydrolase [Bacillus infantis]|uniref:Alpha/beta hydrolase n=1 Tax=Bacillus infantis TaxID=324767 RepID=A0A5D4SN34_9BACI|nr:alpha/beta hydrolase [Bacillus infantis]TYS64693.1 alpha/beta hydrolase [Bacillus infantis]
MASFEYRGGRIFYEEMGSGIPLVFIHPPGMGSAVFECQKPLSGWFRVILPDLSGHGRSPVCQTNISIGGYANEIAALLDSLKIERAAVLGYSAGGLIAQEFALTYPERAAALILASGYPEVQSAAFKYEHLAGMYMIKHHPDILIPLLAASHTRDHAYRARLAEHMELADKQIWFQFYGQSLHYSCTDRLKELKAPLLLMYGSRDFANQHIRSYKKHIDCQSAVIKKVAHQLPTKKWHAFNQVILGFLFSEAKI